MSSTPKVSAGPATYAGYIVAVAGFLTSVGVAVSGTEAQLAGPGKWSAILALIATIATNAGRQLQAKELARAEAASAIAALPSDERELTALEAARPATAAVPDGAQPAAPPAQAAPVAQA